MKKIELSEVLKFRTNFNFNYKIKNSRSRLNNFYVVKNKTRGYKIAFHDWKSNLISLRSQAVLSPHHLNFILQNLLELSLKNEVELSNFEFNQEIYYVNFEAFGTSGRACRRYSKIPTFDSWFSFDDKLFNLTL